MFRRTVTIAGTEQTARSISRYFELLEAPPRYGWDFEVMQSHSVKYETVSYASAVGVLYGSDAQGLRIVLGCDYLRAHHGIPGNLTAVWRLVQVLKANGAVVVFK